MSAKKIDRAQIDKYLKGELDSRAMHRLERAAQDDPFLMDALDGYTSAGGDQQPNLDELDARLAKRVEPAKERNIILWRVIPIAATLLLMIGIGYWALRPKPLAVQYANVIKPRVKARSADTQQRQGEIAQTQPHALHEKNAAETVKPKQSKPNILENAIAAVPQKQAVTYKEDTVDYKVADYKAKKNSTVDELLKRVPGIEVDANGNVTHQGQAVTKVRINGRDFASGDVKAATKNLPADVISKIQVIDDYGDQANRTGIKTGDPVKILNLTTDSLKQQLLATNKPASQFNQSVALARYGLYKKENTLDRVPLPTKADSSLPEAKDKLPQLSEVNIKGYNTEKKIDVIGSMAAISPVQRRADSVNKYTLNLNKLTAADAKPGLTRTITGKVTDKNDGSVLPGVTVTVNGKLGTVTNANGDFKINVPANNQTLNVAYIGFQTKVVNIAAQDNVKVELTPNQAALSEVVVVGYGSRKDEAPAPEYQSATPRDGWHSYNKYLKANTIITTGKPQVVKLEFTVAGNGTISNIKVVKSATDELNNRAIALIKSGPPWQGATDHRPNNVTVRVKFHR